MNAFARAVFTTTAAVALVATPTVAYAGPTDAAAFTQYAAIVAADTRANAADTVAAAVDDNLTCDPQPVVEGQMVTPHAGVVVGELFATVEAAAHWKCVSLDTGVSYSIDGAVYDMYFSGGRYTGTLVATSQMSSIGGAATANPVGVATYSAGSPALNTWHFAHFEGTTSTGRSIAGDSPMYYVPGI